MMNPISYCRIQFDYYIPEEGRRAVKGALISHIPTFAILGAGSLYSRVFLIGVGVGLVDVITKIALYFLFLRGIDQDNTQHTDNKETPFSVSVIYPILEEVVFRGLLQPSLRWAASVCLPDVTMKLAFLPAMSLASIVAVVATSVLFGSVHLINQHSGRKIQAMLATWGGITKGLLAINYGLGPAIGAHIMNNTIAGIGGYIHNHIKASRRQSNQPT